MALRTISLSELDNFKMDENGDLHWKDGKVYVHKRISLRGYELALATIGATGALLAGVHPFLHSFGWV
ncbi:hypothetical protein [Phyllobacterium zundukense]|uniref:Uncharacterized protein n=1 Tax=Phyllobacterium zundukense TaxID=1867719 RepID=A0A2N9W359_9HYPH|nr:hypothetical protein [Phyllobacterium zundukense]ATU94382.1 hypothetical protein BLM14_21825 [Phyllobacterium zundukense]PIO46177.1 hypothetical protein B5P45_03435 [Phyllobacterium zundukense]